MTCDFVICESQIAIRKPLMAQIRFNQAFFGLVAAGVLGSLLIPPSVTDRAKGKVDLLLYPIARPVRGIASAIQSSWGSRNKSLSPGETELRKDSQLAAENEELRQQVVFLKHELEELQLVQAERKRLGKLVEYFAPVTVIGGDASPDRDSLSIVPTSEVDLSAGKPVMCAEGLVGRLTVGRRVRLITDRDYVITGQFGRWENGKWTPLTTPKPSVRGQGRGIMQVVNLTLKDAEVLKPADWVVIADPGDYPDILQGRKVGQIETIRPLPGKPLFAEITVRPSVDLRQLQEVLVMRRGAGE